MNSISYLMFDLLKKQIPKQPVQGMVVGYTEKNAPIIETVTGARVYSSSSVGNVDDMPVRTPVQIGGGSSSSSFTITEPATRPYKSAAMMEVWV